MAQKEYLDPEDARMIEDQAVCLRDQLLIRLLRRTGCRVSEILGIEEPHINFTEHEISIEHEKDRLALFCPNCGFRLSKKDKFCAECNSPVTKVVEKAKSVRNLRKVPIDADTLTLIRQYIKEGGLEEVEGHRYLFRMSRQNARIIVIHCAERAGFNQLVNPVNERLHHVSPHKFRDALAISAMKKRPSYDDARILQEILGHANIDTTMRYRKVANEEVHQFYDDIIGEGENAKPKSTPRRAPARKR